MQALPGYGLATRARCPTQLLAQASHPLASSKSRASPVLRGFAADFHALRAALPPLLQVPRRLRHAPSVVLSFMDDVSRQLEAVLLTQGPLYLQLLQPAGQAQSTAYGSCIPVTCDIPGLPVYDKQYNLIVRAQAQAHA